MAEGVDPDDEEGASRSRGGGLIFRDSGPRGGGRAPQAPADGCSEKGRAGHRGDDVPAPPRPAQEPADHASQQQHQDRQRGPRGQRLPDRGPSEVDSLAPEDGPIEGDGDRPEDGQGNEEPPRELGRPRSDARRAASERRDGKQERGAADPRRQERGLGENGSVEEEEEVVHEPREADRREDGGCASDAGDRHQAWLPGELPDGGDRARVRAGFVHGHLKMVSKGPAPVTSHFEPWAQTHRFTGASWPPRSASCRRGSR